MTLKDLGEVGLIEKLSKVLESPSEDVLIGIGDDTALLGPLPEGLLVTTDSMIEDVHFRWDLFSAYQVGYRLVVRNISDIYAMGGTPGWATLAMALPEDMPLEVFEGILKGISDCAGRYKLKVIGGDLSRANRAMLSMTVLGTPGKRVFKRSSARTGQRIYITGPVGEAGLGLYLLKSLKRPVRIEEGETLNIEPGWTLVEPLIRRACLPEPVGLDRTDGIFATIDLSDGLSIDLWRLCMASGVGARIYWDRLPLSEEMKAVAEAFGLELSEVVLSAGEDYQLLFTGQEVTEGFFEIGEVTGSKCEIVMSDGRTLELGPHHGYEHFRSPESGAHR